MSRQNSVPNPSRQSSSSRRLSRSARLSSLPSTSSNPAFSTRDNAASGSSPKAQRSSKTSQKLVVLPSAPQTKPFLGDVNEDLTHGYETDAGVKEYKSEAEKMNKEQRKMAGFKRITAYCVAETFKMKLLASFLKREHNVMPRVFDEALYVVYHLPLLPGYGPGANIRSSVPAASERGKAFLSRLSEAEENGYQGMYFKSQPARSTDNDGYITSSSPVDTRKPLGKPSYGSPTRPSGILRTPSSEIASSSTIGFMGEDSPPPVRPPEIVVDDIAEVVFFAYGVVVFFGFGEEQEKSILEDIENAGTMNRKIDEDDWEVEECHFAEDPNIAYPRIYNDFFTLKSYSHLLKLSIAHALAQSTLLAHYETNAAHVLSSPQTLSIPTQLAQSGVLQLRRHEALKLTGRLFKLRRDVNLASNVLDVPELFWSEASLKELYDAVREYMEIKGRVQVLNEKLGIAGDFLDAIHDHLNNNAMERITWIIISLILVAILVAMGEVIARLAVHATIGRERNVVAVSKGNALRILEKMIAEP